MRIDAYAGELCTLQEESQKRPVIMFIYSGMYGLSEWVKAFIPSFLETMQMRNAGVYFVKLEKKGNLGVELQKNDMLWTGCVIWQAGQPVERIKMGWLSNCTEVIAKIATRLSDGSVVSVTGAVNNVEHRYRSLPCYVLSRWDQVKELSVKHPLILAIGGGMDTQRAESAFLRRVGGVFADRGFSLTAVSVEKEETQDSVASSLRTAGLKSEGCFVVQNGEVIYTIAKTSPQIGEDGWLNDAVLYLAERHA